MRRFIFIAAACGLLWVPFWSGAGGCEETATSDPGVFVPNLEGSYILRNVTADVDCVGQFDATATITQDERQFVMRASNASFTNLNGTIDEEGEIVATGATTFATPFDCTGQFAADVFSGRCRSEFQVCSVDDAGDVTCLDASVDCAFSYERN